MTGRVCSSRTVKGAGRLAAALILVALSLRPAVVAISPLLDSIRAATGLSPAADGLLTTFPLICFGAFAPIAPRLARRIGMGASPLGCWCC
jgi:CP family cyanate transporter-like MFS transporter